MIGLVNIMLISVNRVYEELCSKYGIKYEEEYRFFKELSQAKSLSLDYYNEIIAKVKRYEELCFRIQKDQDNCKDEATKEAAKMLIFFIANDIQNIEATLTKHLSETHQVNIFF